MPHKRAKRTVRERQRAQSGSDLPPAARNLANEAIPKSIQRVLNAAQVRKDWSEKNKKRSLGEDEDVPGGARKKRRRDGEDKEAPAKKAKIAIQPGESMSHFNRRVEDTMRPAMRTAMKTSSARTRQARKDEAHTSTTAIPKKKKVPALADAVVQASQQRKQPQDFEHLSSSAPRRLNDIVLAPPELKKLPRGAKAATERTVTERNRHRDKGATLKQGALSMARKAMLEEERERAIRMYREMKKVQSDG